ncbi:MAG: hypothetical protein KAJ73_01090 [Zetaproteobacteria bacterium]|nr:hypothetical protein [Zetaproteobacteria bacterium]
MALYSTFKYGDGTKYGAGEQSANLRWTFIVAWDGYYGHGNEANRMVDLSVRRGRSSLIAAGGRGFTPFPPGEATVILDNEDGRFDPFDESSPLYPNVQPGKFVRLAVLDDGNDTNYEIMRGVISDIQPVKRRDIQQVRITVVDGLRWLQNRFIQISVVADDAKYTLAEQIVNDEGVDWPVVEWPWQIIDNTTAALAIQEFWWAWRQNAANAFKELNDAEISVVFHSRDGKITWFPRDYAHLRSTTLEQADLLDDLARPQPWETIRNDIRAQIYKKIRNEEGGVPTLWTLGEVVAIDDGESLSFDALFKFEDWKPATNNPGFVYTVNAQADGGGADLTADVAQTRGGDTGEVSEGVVVILTNNSGSNGFITDLHITGRPFYPPDVNGVTASDTASAAAFGPKTLDLDSRWAENYDQQKTQVEWLLSELKDPIIQPIVQLEDQPTLQFTPDLWDRILFTAWEDVSYRVGQISHQTTSESCQGVRTTFRLEPYLQEV